MSIVLYFIYISKYHGPWPQETTSLPRESDSKQIATQKSRNNDDKFYQWKNSTMKAYDRDKLRWFGELQRPLIEKAAFELSQKDAYA